MSASSGVNRHRRSDGRRTETHRLSASRRDAHTGSRAADGEVRQSLHVTPNAVVATRGAWDFGTVKRFAQWLTDGATDRPHLRF